MREPVPWRISSLVFQIVAFQAIIQTLVCTFELHFQAVFEIHLLVQYVFLFIALRPHCLA